MTEEEFDRIVSKALAGLPEEFAARLENIDIVIQDRPAREQLERMGLKRGETLLGLYEGIPLTERSSGYGMVLPDKVTLFQKEIEEECQYHNLNIEKEIARVVIHELAHHFGISDERIEELTNENEDGWYE